MIEEVLHPLNLMRALKQVVSLSNILLNELDKKRRAPYVQWCERLTLPVIRQGSLLDR
ncbi:MAG: hypothetical protein LBK22_08475 [Tannerella sp.]|jgi:hypothetical protein|nr:hypothetical protein [Tannerella sp.]